MSDTKWRLLWPLLNKISYPKKKTTKKALLQHDLTDPCPFSQMTCIQKYLIRGGSSNFEKGGFQLMKITMCKIHYLSINKAFWTFSVRKFNEHVSHQYLFHIYFNIRVHGIIERFGLGKEDLHNFQPLKKTQVSSNENVRLCYA